MTATADWSDIRGKALPEDAALVERLVRHPPTKGGKLPRWSHVSAAFSVGCTTGTALCKRFGQDPDELIGEDPWDEEGPL